MAFLRMIPRFCLSAAVLLLLACFQWSVSADADSPSWDSRQLDTEFRAEGVGVGDLNGDGVPDLAYGPFWLTGPDFVRPIRFAEGDPFVPEKGYSDNFFSFIQDFNGDGLADILVLGFPGKEARLYLNPGNPSSHKGLWTMHIIADQISNESPALIDLIPGGLPEIVCSRDKAYGYYEATEDVTKPWIWHSVSETGDAAKPFGHGLGVGDLDGDGRLDVIEKDFWYRQPDSLEKARQGIWEKQRWSPESYGGGGAQILVHDFDGDGDADIVTSYNAHGYGLGWFEQHEPGKFRRHDLLGETSTQNEYGVAFSQLHALVLCDIDGDGRMDFVTGKRHYAHQGKDPGGLQDPVLYWFRNTREADGRMNFVPYLVSHGAGAGVELKIADLDGDGRLDVVSGSKQGLSIHLQRDALSGIAERWAVPGGRPQDGYGSGLSPEQALARMEVPKGFSVDLIAAEPDLVQPIAMNFDSRGRLWVVEGVTYPQRAAEGEGKDRILIFEDVDGDGRFEKRKVFAEHLNLVSGIAVGFGGVYVGAAPYLHFYPDKNQDDIPDGEAEVLLDGWSYPDTHETLNSFTWGPDGWLYGCHGVFNQSKVGAPGAPDDARTPINAGLWRFHPVTRQFEVYAEGTSNPWGVDFDARGDFFVSACVIPHFYHLSQGGRYQRQAGPHFNPWTFDDIKTVADHLHYAGKASEHAFWGKNKITRPAAPNDTSALGGGHAHCGLVIYQADQFPKAYRGDAFFHNLHGHRVVREAIEGDGSGHIARHRPDFLLANHHDHIGVALQQGPDGALYLSDWTDPQTCHHRDVEIWNRSNGRIYRVRYGEALTSKIDLPSRSDTELVALLDHTNSFHARHAQRLLQERATTGQLNREAVKQALSEFETSHKSDSVLRLRALWTRHVAGLLDESALRARLDDSAEEIRGWAITLLGESKSALADATLARLIDMADPDQGDRSLFVRRHLASLLQRIPLDQRWDIATGLITHPLSLNDRNIPLLCWYGIEPLVESNPSRALDMSIRTSWPMMKDFLIRRAAGFDAGREALLTSLMKVGRPDEFLSRLTPVLNALSQLPPMKAPAGWAALKKRGKELAKDSKAVADALARLGSRFGDPEYFDVWRAVARDAKVELTARTEALQLLSSSGDPQLGDLARALLAEPKMRPSAVIALRAFPSRETAEALVPLITDFPAGLRNDAINLLAVKPESALILLQAIDQKKIASSLVAPALLDQFGRFKVQEIDEIIARNWVRGGQEIAPEKLAESVNAWKKKLEPLLSRADASQGRRLFATTCGICHTLYGEGIALGPDLTGSNRSDLGYLLENVLAPSAVVGKDYLLHIFTLRDGTTLSGILRSQNDDFAKLVMPGGSVVDVKLADVVKHEELPQSLMPVGLFDALPIQDVAHLVKYLSGTAQVSLLGETTNALSTPPCPAGAQRFEGEKLVEMAKSQRGSVRPQGMKGFGTGWSGDAQLWWTGGEPGDVLSIRIKGLKPGTHDVTLYPTTAKDYALIRVSINGQLQEADLYSQHVLLGQPMRFEKVNISPTEPLQIDVHLVGKNDDAVPRYMFGLDCVDVIPRKSGAK